MTSVTYNVKLNEALSDSFAPSRGLRQGDPLSPFLFLLVADGLDAILKQKVLLGRISPLHVCPRAPGISHLLFADDTLLFFHATAMEAREIRDALAVYERTMGQFINPMKCSILFGSRCRPEAQAAIMQVLQVQNQEFEERYLGLPTPTGRMSKGRFQSLQEQLTKRILLWGDAASQGGKEVLIKAVAQSLPTYLMSVFHLPRSVCDDLTRMVRNFWWGAKEGKRKTHWRVWDMMIKPKNRGGMGFRDFRLLNQALLAQQAWRLISNPDSLCAQVLKARYYPDGRLEDTVFSGNASPTWQAVVHGLDLLKKGLIWRIGDGSSVCIWRD